MTRILLAGAAFFALTSMAQAADPYQSMYGNTTTWEQHGPNGMVVKGTYAWKDATTACFTQTDPAPQAGAQPLCLQNQGMHNVGETWTVAGMDGKPVTVSITAGR
jgi:hypothetical protein